MRDLADDDTEAFFTQGDAGTYEGGPARSLAPVGIEETAVEVDDARPRPSLEQLVRREKMKRVVTTVVGSLAAVAVIGLVLRLTRSEPDAQAAQLRTEQPVKHASAPTEAPARVAVADVRPEPESFPAPPTLPATVEEEVVEAPAIQPASVARPSVKSVTETVTLPAALKHAQRVPAREPAAAPRAVSRPAPVQSTGSHAPPTAVFPD